MKDPNKQLRNLTESVNRLHEQLPPAGGGNGFGQTDPSIPSIQQIGDAPSRGGRPRSPERVTTRALQGGYPTGPPPFVVDPTWEAGYDRWVATQDTTDGFPSRWGDGSMAGFPPPMISNPAALEYHNIDDIPEGWPVGDMNQESYNFWWSFLSWFVGSDNDQNGIPDFNTPYDAMMNSRGLAADYYLSDADGYTDIGTMMQQAANGDLYAMNYCLGQALYYQGGMAYYGEGPENAHMHIFFGSLFWGESFEGNPAWWRYWDWFPY